MSETHFRPGRFVWCSLMTTDLDAAKKFYLALFPTWQHAAVDMGPEAPPYDRLSIDGHGIGGMVAVQGGVDTPSRWVPFATVRDVEAACAAVVELGGKVTAGPAEVPQRGRFAIVEDGQGAVFAPFALLEEPPEQSGPMPEGAFCWHELLSKRPEEAARFYTEVLGWTHAEVPTPLGPYHLFRRGDRDAAGMMPMPSDATGRPAWLVYVYTSDVAAAAEKVKALGGSILAPPKSMPGIGQLAVAQDPTGALFALFRSERA
jgi:hypothetical protein